MIEFLGYEPAELAASPVALVQELTALRRRMRLARSEVAESLGLAYKTIWAWETGRRRPRGRSIRLLRKFLARVRNESAGSK